MSEAMPVKGSWVVGSFEGEQAKRVVDHADAGVGYIILERAGSKVHPAVLAAFRRAEDSPIPVHLNEVKDHYKIEKYEETRRQRAGIQHRPVVLSTTTKQMSDVRENLKKSGLLKRKAKA